MPDEKMTGRTEIGRPKKRSSAHMIEVEWWACRISDSLTGEPVDDMAALPKMRQERECKAQKPHVCAGDTGHDGENPDRMMCRWRESSQHPLEHLHPTSYGQKSIA